MKTLKTTFTALLIVFAAASFAKADQGLTENEKLKIKYAVTAYMDAMSDGKLKGFSDILDDNAKFHLKRGQKMLTYTKDQILGGLKSSSNVKQNCQTDYAIIESHPTQAILKVTMKYDNFSRINYITMSDTVNGWKITNVASTFE